MFENYKNCLKATQLENKTNYNEKVKLTQIVWKKSRVMHKKTQQRFKRERQNLFT